MCADLRSCKEGENPIPGSSFSLGQGINVINVHTNCSCILEEASTKAAFVRCNKGGILILFH